MKTLNESKISVVICSYTEARWNDLLAAVRSIQTQTRPAFEIIVVIDHNPRMLARVHAEIPDVIGIPNREAQGLSGGRNSGAQMAQGDVIGFLDDDAIAAPDWLQWLATSLEQPNVMGAGGLVKPMWSEEKPDWFPEEFYWVLGCSYRGLPQEPSQVRNLFGGCMCVRRELFDELGGFTSGIGRANGRPMGCEETELCIRAFQHFHGIKFIYEPRAWAWHRIIPGRASWNYFRERCYAEGLSKAKVSALVGAGDALSSEWRYTLHTLTRGVWRGLAHGIVERDAAAFGRGGAILAGLFFTGMGYMVGTFGKN